MKQGDTAHPLIMRAAYSSPSSGVLDLPGDTPAYVTMTRDGSAEPTLDHEPVDTVSSAGGVATFTRAWADPSECDVPGAYRVEVLIYLNGGVDTLRLPTHGYGRLVIEPALAWPAPDMS